MIRNCAETTNGGLWFWKRHSETQKGHINDIDKVFTFSNSNIHIQTYVFFP